MRLDPRSGDRSYREVFTCRLPYRLLSATAGFLNLSAWVQSTHPTAGRSLNTTQSSTVSSTFLDCLTDKVDMLAFSHAYHPYPPRVM